MTKTTRLQWWAQMRVQYEGEKYRTARFIGYLAADDLELYRCGGVFS
jgi:hypothetical protein